MLSIGPQIVACDDDGDLTPGVRFTGRALEFSNQELALTIPIYRHVHSWNPSETDLDDFVFHEKFQSFDLKLWGNHVVHTKEGSFLPLGSFVCALYAHYPQSRCLEGLLSDIRETLVINSNHTRREFTRPTLLCSPLRARGFEVVGSMSHGRSLYLDLVWSFPQDRISGEPLGMISVGSLVFRPSPSRELKASRWNAVEGRRFADLLWNQAAALCDHSQIDALSEEGTEFALSTFEWSKLAKLTPKEARAARIAFIRRHPDLIEVPKRLAEALKAEELYSSATSIHQIYKFLPALIAEATRTA